MHSSISFIMPGVRIGRNVNAGAICQRRAREIMLARSESENFALTSLLIIYKAFS
jgi:hypothetical protein